MVHAPMLRGSLGYLLFNKRSEVEVGSRVTCMGAEESPASLNVDHGTTCIVNALVLATHSLSGDRDRFSMQMSVRAATSS